eukprot:gene1074-1217_t
MNELEVILLGVSGEKGNVFVYERDNSAQIKEDTIMMNARFYLRSTIYSLDRQLHSIGSRADKTYFSVVGTGAGSRADNERVLSMVPVSKNWPIPLATEVGRSTYRTIIKSLEIHPFISVPLLADFLPDKSCAVSVRPFYARGSLRDYIHQAKPRSKYTDKYAAQYQLNDKLISKFGRQILEALIFLKHHNFPYFHLNASNVLLDDTTCLIADYENAFLGLKPRFAKFLASFSDKLDPEVLCFGFILYEMGCGYELESPEAIELGLPGHCHPEVKKILESIFKPWYGNPPTLDELAKLSFFSDWKFKNLPIQRRDMLDAAAKLNKSFITSTKAEDLPSLKKLKKQKKRKNLTFVPMEVPTTATPIPSGQPSSLASSYVPLSSAPIAATTPPKAPTPSSGAPPPPPPPKAPSPPTPPANTSIPPPPSSSRSNLLSSIEGFSSAKLKKTKTKDRSAPKVDLKNSTLKRPISSPASTMEELSTPDAIRARCESQLQIPDSIMSIDVAQVMKDYITTGGSPPDVIRFLSESYRGFAQMCNLLCSWLAVSGLSKEAVTASFKNHLKDIIMERFDPKKADTIFSSNVVSD